MIVKTKKGDLPVRYGWSALAKFGDISGMTMDDVLELDLKKMKMSDLLRFILVGFQDGARYDGQECIFKSIEEIGDLLDDEPNVVEKIMDAFAEMTKAEEGGDKKK